MRRQRRVDNGEKSSGEKRNISTDPLFDAARFEMRTRSSTNDR